MYNFEVDDIPDVLLKIFETNGSIHASSILNGCIPDERDIVPAWIKCNVVAPDDFELHHDHSVPCDKNNVFKGNRLNFEARKYSVWRVECNADRRAE